MDGWAEAWYFLMMLAAAFAFTGIQLAGVDEKHSMVCLGATLTCGIVMIAISYHRRDVW